MSLGKIAASMMGARSQRNVDFIGKLLRQTLDELAVIPGLYRAPVAGAPASRPRARSRVHEFHDRSRRRVSRCSPLWAFGYAAPLRAVAACAGDGRDGRTGALLALKAPTKC
jgi:hypothetical protein